MPAGILMMGVSGCGKSLAAKTIPSVWGLPLIRLDMNKIMSGGWGAPEVAWERAIRAAENAAPVVLWIDEIENSFGFLTRYGDQWKHDDFLVFPDLDAGKASQCICGSHRQQDRNIAAGNDP